MSDSRNRSNAMYVTGPYTCFRTIIGSSKFLTQCTYFLCAGIAGFALLLDGFSSIYRGPTSTAITSFSPHVCCDRGRAAQSSLRRPAADVPRSVLLNPFFVGTFAFENYVGPPIGNSDRARTELLARTSIATLLNVAADANTIFFACCLDEAFCQNMSLTDRKIQVIRCPPRRQDCWVTYVEELKVAIMQRVPWDSTLIFIETDMLWYGSPRVLLPPKECDINLFFREVGRNGSLVVKSLNTGVISLKVTPRVLSFMQLWLQQTELLEDANSCEGGGNQVVFAENIFGDKHIAPSVPSCRDNIDICVCGRNYHDYITGWERQSLCGTQHPLSVVAHLKGANRVGSDKTIDDMYACMIGG